MTSQNLNSWETENLSLLLKPGNSFRNTQHKPVLPTTQQSCLLTPLGGSPLPPCLPPFLRAQALKRITFRNRSILAFSCAESTQSARMPQSSLPRAAQTFAPAQRDAEATNHTCFFQLLYWIKNDL